MPPFTHTKTKLYGVPSAKNFAVELCQGDELSLIPVVFPKSKAHSSIHGNIESALSLDTTCRLSGIQHTYRASSSGSKPKACQSKDRVYSPGESVNGLYAETIVGTAMYEGVTLSFDIYIPFRPPLCAPSPINHLFLHFFPKLPAFITHCAFSCSSSKSQL